MSIIHHTLHHAPHVFLLLITCVLAGGKAQATTDTTLSHHPGAAIMAIVSLGFDCYRDSVIGWPDEHGHYLPHIIRWGKPLGTDNTKLDPACFDYIPPSRKVRQTVIEYPAWQDLTGSVAIERFNSDSLSDLVLYIKGTVGSSSPHDSLMPLVLFGQHGLDTLPVIDVSGVGEFQSQPFFAMRLHVGTNFIEPARRDLTGITSYVFQGADYNVQQPNVTHEEPIVGMSGRMHVYPNPTGTTASLEAEALPAGAYSIEVVGVNGQIYARADATVDASGALARTLDVARLPSGYYVVRLHQHGQAVNGQTANGQAATGQPGSGQTATQPLRSYPIVITR